MTGEIPMQNAVGGEWKRHCQPLFKVLNKQFTIFFLYLTGVSGK